MGRLYWTGFGLPANIVEEYVLLSALLHVFVAMKRTWDSKLAMGLKSGQLNLAISGLMLLTFMTVHLFQFRFGDTAVFGPYYIRPPPYLINLWGIINLNNFNLFWTDAPCDKHIREWVCATSTNSSSRFWVTSTGPPSTSSPFVFS